MSDGQKFTCSCGFTWLRGQSGSHECGPYYLNRIAELERQVAELRRTLECAKGWCLKGGQAEAIISAALAQAKTEES